MFLDDYFSNYQLLVLVKIILAALAGGVIGLERETHGRPAGLRTHLLVAVGACLMMVISEAFSLKYGGTDGTGPLRIDPSRVAAQIVAGIGFLGAGVILKEGLSIRGLTTAASLWLAAGLGMAFGIGLFGPAIFSTAIGLASLIFLKRLEPVLNKTRYLNLDVTAGLESDIYPDLERIFAECRLSVSDVAGVTDFQNNEVEYQFVLTQQKRRVGRELTALIAPLPGVRKVRFK